MNQIHLCIAGAHRSGTSMLTRLLHRCGLDLGPEEELMAAAADNPDGFWENLRFVQLNDEVLNAVGAAWDLPPWQDEAFDSASLQPMRAKAQLLIERFRGKPVWGWKDPRNCLTLPFWQSLLPDLKTIIIVRNPLEAAYSMHKRNGTSYALGLRLWEIYNRRLLADTHAKERIITHYGAFFEEPDAELEKIATFAGLDCKETVAAAALIAKHRRHTTFTTEQMIDAGVSAQIVTLYRSLIDTTAKRSSGAEKANRSSPLERDQLSGTENKLNTSVPNGEDVRRELATRRGDAIQHREEVARFEKAIAGLREELARRDGRIEELQKAYAHIDQLLQKELTQRNQLLAELERNRQQSARDTEEITRLRERFTQANQLSKEVSIRLADSETQNASLTGRLRRQLLEMKRLLRLLDQIDEAAGLLRRSRRWKLANPFAALLAACTGKPLRGFGHIDNNVAKYRSWRSSHPEVASLAEEIQALRSREILSPPAPVEFGRAAKPEPVATAKPPLPTAPIEFPKHDQVEVSIIIPVYNQIDFTRACLASVQEHSGDSPYEVIVVDDASTDATRDIIEKISNISYLRTEINAGFIASCNRGAEAARGKYLVFLNNDTIVRPGWLNALLETFEFEPRAGLVGSKLVFPDGRLQEAGGIIWRDATGWNRGKFDDPGKPEYSYLREVDYCSAASVMIPKALFESLSGFDCKYTPAYYEDTDFAFKVAQSGRRVLYQPLSVVIHYEGATGGTDISAGAKRYQEINRATFAAAWADTLANKPVNGNLAANETLQPGQRRILVIDHHLPMPDRDSGSLRMFQILKILQGLGHRVTFIPDNLANIPPYADELQKHGIEVVCYPYIKSVREYLETNAGRFDVVVLSRCDYARKHIADVRLHQPQSRIIFDTVDLHFLREDREADLMQDSEIKRMALEKRKLEYDLIDQADETWAVSDFEQALLRNERPDKSIEVVSNIVDVPGSATPFSLRRDFLFIGSFQHTPNIDAVLFFTKEIYPLVQARLPKANFYVIGDKAPPTVVALASENIIITGLQPDVRPFFDSVKLSIAPLRWGAGVKGKINQSMGFGVPVVATTVAVEGMALTNREDVLIADTPGEFASALIDLYESEDLWTRVSARGLEKTKATYSTEAARKQLMRLFSDSHLGSSDPRRCGNEGFVSTDEFAVGLQIGAAP